MSKVMLQIRGFGTEIATNYAVESWFDKLKNREKQFKKPLPAFIQAQAEIVDSKLTTLCNRK